MPSGAGYSAGNHPRKPAPGGADTLILAFSHQGRRDFPLPFALGRAPPHPNRPMDSRFRGNDDEKKGEGFAVCHSRLVALPRVPTTLWIPAFAGMTARKEREWRGEKEVE